jgi:cardiolipin synthase
LPLTLERLRRHLPTALTLLRLALTPAVALAVLAERDRAALVFFLAAGVSDGVDGALARRWGAVTRLGALLDPVTDKILLVAVYLALAVRGVAPWWLVALVVARDLLILFVAGVLLAAKRAAEFRPSVWGKAATTIHVATVTTLLVLQATGWGWVRPPAAALVLLAGAATLWSGCHYGWLAARHLRGDRGN